jgi:hypothetical protein
LEGDGSKAEQAMLSLAALGNLHRALHRLHAILVDSAIRNAAALAYDDPPS